MRVPWLAAVLLALTSVAGAQGGGPPDRREGRGDEDRAEAFRMVDAYLLSNMQESLGLGDEQYVKLLPVVKRLQTERRASVERRMAAMRTLRDLLAGGRASEAQVTDALKALRAAEAEVQAAQRRNLDAIDAALTPLQQAKFRVLEFEVERKIRQLRMRGERPGMQRGNRRGGGE